MQNNNFKERLQSILTESEFTVIENWPEIRVVCKNREGTVKSLIRLLEDLNSINTHKYDGLRIEVLEFIDELNHHYYIEE